VAATTRELEKVAAMVAGGRLGSAAKSGRRVGQVANKYKVRKHFEIAIGGGALTVRVDEASVAAEAALDGLYVLRRVASAARPASTQPVAAQGKLSSSFRDFGLVDQIEAGLDALESGVMLGKLAMDQRVLADEAGSLKAEFDEVLFELKHFCGGLVTGGANMPELFEDDIVDVVGHGRSILKMDAKYH
jgi:hypothetical protein